MHISNELRLWMNVVGNRFFAVQIFIWRGTHNVFLHFWSNVLYCILESFCDFQSRHGSHATLNGTRMENLCGKSLRKLPRKHIGWIKKRNDIVISSVNREENLYSNRLFERFEIIWAYISIYVKGFLLKAGNITDNHVCTSVMDETVHNGQTKKNIFYCLCSESFYF